MDLKDRIKRGSQPEFGGTPFRQSNLDRNNFMQNQPLNPYKYSNRQVPRSVQYQPDQPHEDNPVQGEEVLTTHNSYSDVNNENYVASPQYSDFNQSFDTHVTPQSEENLQFNYNTTDMHFNEQSVSSLQEEMPVFETTSENNYSNSENQQQSNVNNDEVKNEFFSLLSSLFQRYQIEKVLIVENKIYAADFTDDRDDEIFDEILDKDIIISFAKIFAPNGYFEANLEDGYKVEVIYEPISDIPTIIISKCNFESYIDEEFVTILFEFLGKRKNVVILSNTMIETLFKAVSDYYNNNLCVTVNEPIKTENNIAFKENLEKPLLKTVFSVSKKIEPDNTLIFKPADLFSTLNYMKKNNGTILFSETDTPSDFVNSDAMTALGGLTEYNKITILKGIDIIFTVSKTKNNSTRYVGTQLLSPTNKSHINKIKRIVGDAAIDMNKIYFYNLFEREI